MGDSEQDAAAAGKVKMEMSTPEAEKSVSNVSMEGVKGQSEQRPWQKKVWGQQVVPQEIPKELIPSDAVDVTFGKTGKLWKVPLEPGDGNTTWNPRYGSLVQIHYKCWLLTDPDKKVIDSSQLFPGDDTPFEFNVGTRSVIKAIDFGVRSMTKKGEKALFVAHYDYAFGRNSAHRFESSNIPNFSHVCVEIELVDADDGSIGDYETAEVTRKVIHLAGNESENDPPLSPLTSNSVMFVRLEGFKVVQDTDDKLVEEQRRYFLEEVVLPYTPCFNTWGFDASGNTQYAIPHELGHLLKVLRKGDKILFTLSGDSAFQEDVEYNGVTIKAGEPVKFIVTMDDVEESLDPFELSFQEKVSICETLIIQGKHYYDHKWFEAAICKFLKVRDYLAEAKLYLKKVPTDLGNKADDLLSKSLCKMAKLYRKLPAMTAKEALMYCNEALELLKGVETDTPDQLNFGDRLLDVYSLRAGLYEQLKEHEMAKKDYAMVVELTRKRMESLTVGIKQNENADEVGGGDDEHLGEDKDHFDKLKELNQKAMMQLKGTEVKLAQEIKNYPFKYVPPK